MMSRFDTTQIYTKRTYYFGLIGLISFLIMRSLVGIKMLTSTPVPSVLFLFVLTISVFCSVICLYTMFKARKESGSFKKVVASLLAIASAVYIVSLIIEAYHNYV